MALKKEFICQGKSEVKCVPYGSMGCSQIRVKGMRDHFKSNELINFLYKIDNLNNKNQVKYVLVKIIRTLKFRA